MWKVSGRGGSRKLSIKMNECMIQFSLKLSEQLSKFSPKNVLKPHGSHQETRSSCRKAWKDAMAESSVWLFSQPGTVAKIFGFAPAGHMKSCVLKRQ